MGEVGWVRVGSDVQGQFRYLHTYVYAKYYPIYFCGSVAPL